MSLVLPAATATSTSDANSTRFSSMFQCARDARPPQPVISGRPSRLPTSVMRPTLLNAACAATSICTTVRTTDHTSRFSSGFIAPPRRLYCGRYGTPISAGSRGDDVRREVLREQVADADRDVLARERSKVQIDAQHLLRPVGGLEGERKGHAEFGAGDRQIGPRDLDVSRSLDRAAEVGPGLPIGALGGLHQFEAGVVGINVAFRVHVGADLQSIAADQIAALCAGEL